MPNSNEEALPDVVGAQEPQNKASRAEAMERIKAQMQAVERVDLKTGTGGAMPRATKAMLLDATEAIAKNPESRVRWVNVANAEKAQLRVLSGYQRLSSEQGGRQVGNLVLMAIPREVYEQRVAHFKKVHRDRLKAHKNEMEEAAEGLARLMRDQHGVNIDVRRLLIQEGVEQG